MCSINSTIAADLSSYNESKKSISSTFQRFSSLSFSIVDMFWEFDVLWNSEKLGDSKKSKFEVISQIKPCKAVHCCWKKSIFCQLSTISILPNVKVRLMKLLMFCLNVCWSIGWLLEWRLMSKLLNWLLLLNSILCTITKLTRGTEMSRKILSMNFE